jgi:hypothetical protein
MSGVEEVKGRYWVARTATDKARVPTVANLIDRTIVPKERNAKRPETVVLLGPSDVAIRSTEPGRFEQAVLNFFVTQRKQLGLRTVSHFYNQLIDGELVLADGRRLALEVKYKMNWPRACQADWQIERFLVREREVEYAAGLVVFSEFSADWARSWQSHERGWRYWYLDHSWVMGNRYRVDLVRFNGRVLEGYPSA